MADKTREEAGRYIHYLLRGLIHEQTFASRKKKYERFELYEHYRIAVTDANVISGGKYATIASDDYWALFTEIASEYKEYIEPVGVGVLMTVELGDDFVKIGRKGIVQKKSE